MSEDLFGAVSDEVAGDAALENKDSRFLLKSITVYNWGPFVGMQRPAEIHEDGSAIIGATGSGKTTLVDALMTLLVMQPRYNFASTGGHDKNDRSMVSYVRGVKGVESAAGNNSNTMRPGKTVTALSASYSDGEVSLKIGGILWFEGNGNAASDMKKKWFVIRNHDEGLADILRIFDDGGVRELKKYAKGASHFEFFDSKKSYLAMLRRFFEVGENAFTLLNRAAGLKQLNSINQIFRELVLDNKPAFDDALRVSASFDDLAEIREELELAKKQRDSLLPIKKEHRIWQKNLEKQEQWKEFQSMIPVWFAQRGVVLWTQNLETIEEGISTLKVEQVGLERSEEEKRQTEQVLLEKYMQQGGSRIEEVKQSLITDRHFLTQVRTAADKYDHLARQLGLQTVRDEMQFKANQMKLEVLLTDSSGRKDSINEEILQLKAQNIHLANDFNARSEELKEVKNRPKSNIPAKFQYFRDELANELGVVADELPFIAEMLEVRAEERSWTGAIERALGSERLRILVPAEQMQQALSWVNQRNNRLHVRLLQVEPHYAERSFFEDSYVHKLTLKEHSNSYYHGALRSILKQQDRHCVSSVDELREVEYAMTIEGTMSGRSGKFEKQDQHSLTKDWMTGFDNQYQLAYLESEIERITEELKIPLQQEQGLKGQLLSLEKQLDGVKILRDFDFERMDVASLEERVLAAEKRLAELDSPNSDLAKSRVAYETIGQELKEIRNAITMKSGELGKLKEQRDRVSRALQDAEQDATQTLTEEQLQELERQMQLPQVDNPEDLMGEQRKADGRISSQLIVVEEKIQKNRENLVSQMAKARNVDSGALVESGTEISDLSDYLKRLDYLLKEDLPARQKAFIEYLNHSSSQNVTRLFAKIDNEVSQIKDRIEQLNATLGKVEYKPGFYLMLEAAEVGSEMLKRLSSAQKRLRLSILQEDEGESHYAALRALVDIIRECANNRRNVGSLSLLDARYRLQFFVREVDRETQIQSGRIAGSQTGSGGEKEMMASYILTASLSYALCPKGATQPRYATIVLDEAFSKSSQSAASKIIQALREFGLHPLFVTPNKEMRLLRHNTRSAILVHNAKLTSLTWRELDEIQASQATL